MAKLKRRSHLGCNLEIDKQLTHFELCRCKKDHLEKLMALTHQKQEVRHVAKQQVQQLEKIKKLKKQVYKFEETRKLMLYD